MGENILYVYACIHTRFTRDVFISSCSSVVNVGKSPLFVSLLEPQHWYYFALVCNKTSIRRTYTCRQQKKNNKETFQKHWYRRTWHVTAVFIYSRLRIPLWSDPHILNVYLPKAKAPCIDYAISPGWADRPRCHDYHIFNELRTGCAVE